VSRRPVPKDVYQFYESDRDRKGARPILSERNRHSLMFCHVVKCKCDVSVQHDLQNKGDIIFLTVAGTPARWLEKRCSSAACR
jgi:hypothetical protein